MVYSLDGGAFPSTRGQESQRAQQPQQSVAGGSPVRNTYHGFDDGAGRRRDRRLQVITTGYLALLLLSILLLCTFILSGLILVPAVLSQ